MQKSDYLQPKKLNPSDELRELLSNLENQQLKLKGIGSTQTLGLLRDLDRINNLFEQLEANGANLLSERVRFEYVQARLKKDVSLLLRALGGSAALSEFRPKPVPPPEQWWWYIHEIVAARQQRSLRRIIKTIVVVVLVVGALILAFNTVLAPAPETIARLEAENKANDAVEIGDYRTSLAAIEAGLVDVPNDPGLLIYKGVLHQTLGEDEAAMDAYAQAQKQLTDAPLSFYLARSQLRMRFQQPALAEQDARTVLEQDENVSRAWLLLGQSLQVQGNQFEAIPAYEKAGQIAFENGENEIVVLARLALGQIGVSP